MNMVDISSTVEITTTRLTNKKGLRRFMNVGNTSLTPTMI